MGEESEALQDYDDQFESEWAEEIEDDIDNGLFEYASGQKKHLHAMKLDELKKAHAFALKSAESVYHHAVSYAYSKQANEIKKEINKRKKTNNKKIPATQSSMFLQECKCCRQTFLAREADINRGWGIYCSKSCKAKDQNKSSSTKKRIKSITIEFY